MTLVESLIANKSFFSLGTEGSLASYKCISLFEDEDCVSAGGCDLNFVIESAITSVSSDLNPFLVSHCSIL